MQTVFFGITLLYSLLFILLVLFSCVPGLRKYRVYSKGLTSAVFVWMACMGIHTSGQGGVILCMLPGFFCCFIGDILLGIVTADGKKKYMKAGALLFAAGHIWYVIGLDAWVHFSVFQLIIPCMGVVVMYFLLKLPMLHPGKMYPYAILYAFFVSMLFSKGIFVLYNEMCMRNMVLFIGTTLFFISDFIIVFLYFGEKKGKFLGFLNMFTYFMAQYFLAWSLYFGV